MQPFHNVVDQRFQAGRGDEYSATRRREQEQELIELARLDAVDFSLPRDHRIEDNVDLSDTYTASLHEAIPASNVGYKLLEKMGWRGGGLGRSGTGGRLPTKRFLVPGCVLLRFPCQPSPHTR